MPFSPNSVLCEKKLSLELSELARFRYQLYTCGNFFRKLCFEKIAILG